MAVLVGRQLRALRRIATGRTLFVDNRTALELVGRGFARRAPAGSLVEWDLTDVGRKALEAYGTGEKDAGHTDHVAARSGSSRRAAATAKPRRRRKGGRRQEEKGRAG